MRVFESEHGAVKFSIRSAINFQLLNGIFLDDFYYNLTDLFDRLYLLKGNIIKKYTESLADSAQWQNMKLTVKRSLD